MSPYVHEMVPAQSNKTGPHTDPTQTEPIKQMKVTFPVSSQWFDPLQPSVSSSCCTIIFSILTFLLCIKIRAEVTFFTFSYLHVFHVFISSCFHVFHVFIFSMFFMFFMFSVFSVFHVFCVFRFLFSMFSVFSVFFLFSVFSVFSVSSLWSKLFLQSVPLMKTTWQMFLFTLNLKPCVSSCGWLKCFSVWSFDSRSVLCLKNRLSVCVSSRFRASQQKHSVSSLSVFLSSFCPSGSRQSQGTESDQLRWRLV